MSAPQLKLQEVMHISEVKKLQEQLLTILNDGQGIEIDAADVERADTASIQLLLAAKQSFQQADFSFSLINVPDVLRKNILSLGLQQAFEIS